MRCEKEIVRAHDLLVGILLGDIPASAVDIDPFSRTLLQSATDVLCWILQHEHNDTFASNLKNLEEAAQHAGYFLRSERRNAPGAN